MNDIANIYGSMVFNEHTMQGASSSATYKQLMKTMKEGAPLNEEVANVVARDEGMGYREGRHPLHPLVPAAFGRDLREARQLPDPPATAARS